MAYITFYSLTNRLVEKYFEFKSNLQGEIKLIYAFFFSHLLDCVIYNKKFNFQKFKSINRLNYLIIHNYLLNRSISTTYFNKLCDINTENLNYIGNILSNMREDLKEELDFPINYDYNDNIIGVVVEW